MANALLTPARLAEDVPFLDPLPGETGNSDLLWEIARKLDDCDDWCISEIRRHCGGRSAYLNGQRLEFLQSQPLTWWRTRIEQSAYWLMAGFMSDPDELAEWLAFLPGQCANCGDPIQAGRTVCDTCEGCCPRCGVTRECGECREHDAGTTLEDDHGQEVSHAA